MARSAGVVYKQKSKNPEMGLQFYGTKPPRPDSARASLDTPPIHFVAGGEMTTPELAEFQNENGNEFSLHHLIPSSPF